MFQCEHCDFESGSARGLKTHMGMKHKNINVQLMPKDEQLLNDLVSINKEAQEFEGGAIRFDVGRAVRSMRDIRATLSGLYGISNEKIGEAVAAEFSFHMENIRATAQSEYDRQMKNFGRSVNPRILAAQRLAEDTQNEGDVYAAVVAPIELGMDSRVWVSGTDEGAVDEINGLLSAWDVMSTITAAWQDMETYSAFYVLHRWKNGTPTPIHLSPKRVAVGPDTGFGPYSFRFLGPGKLGDELQTQIEFAEAPQGKEWNEWMQGLVGSPLPMDQLSWIHFLKPKHKMYPYPWLAKAATPVYTRQIIEEMRLALVQGIINQLWVMTIENPLPSEVAKLKSVISANRAERVGFLLWRAGLKVDVYGPESIEQLLLPDSWWSATLDIFRRMGRTIRIISGESAQRSGQGSGDPEIDVRVAQNKAMAHRSVVANKIVKDMIRQWSNQQGTQSQAVKTMLDKGGLDVHMTPIQLFLGEELKNLWGPMWDRGMASVRTIHAALGLDTDTETGQMEHEKDQGFDEIYQARQQFAQRVATPSGAVTRSAEPGRPEGQTVTAAMEETERRLQDSFNAIDNAEEPEERRKRVLAFIILLETLLRAHIRDAYSAGYKAAYGAQSPSSTGLDASIAWEQQYIDGFREDLLAAVDMDKLVGPSEGYRVTQHVQASWRRGYMDGVFQAKREDGWMFWQRVLRPWASKTGPCEICTEDSKRWHPITEPFWDHPYGVCSAQVVRFMRTSTDGWQSLDRQMVQVPLMDWEE